MLQLGTQPLHWLSKLKNHRSNYCKMGYMDIDPKLNEVDDCLYRVAVRFFVMNNDKVLLIYESEGDWWALPGGGIDHGETVEVAMYRELEEELGIAHEHVHSDFRIAHYTIGAVVNGVPRMNIYIKVKVAHDLLRITSHTRDLQWFDRDSFMNADLHQSFDKKVLASVIFGN